MELSFKDLSKRDVINVSDGKSLGYVTDITLSFPMGTLTGITVPGKKVNCITKLFFRGAFFIPENKIVRIGNDVILVDLKCGDYCAESASMKGKGRGGCSPCPPFCDPCSQNNGNGKGYNSDDDFN